MMRRNLMLITLGALRVRRCLANYFLKISSNAKSKKGFSIKDP